MMNEKIELSVIIPVYGTEKYIDTCLTSALKAVEDINAEILVINDGTKDNAGIIAKQYATEHPDKIKYFEKENGGLADTKNYGVKRARGEFVTFLDSDDFIEKEMYSEMLSKAKNDQVDCVVCDITCDYVDEGRSVYQKCAAENREGIFHKLIDTPLMASSCNKIMKLELLEGLSYPIGMNNEDIAVTPIAMGRSNKLAYIPKAFYHYVQRTGSIQNSSFSRKRFVILDVCKLALDRIKGIQEEQTEQIKSAIYVHQVLAIPFYLIRKLPFKDRYSLLKEYMQIVERYFPDFFENYEVYEYTTWASRVLNIYRKMCLSLVKHRMYLAASLAWCVANKFEKD